jgi:hypothetical protein
VESNSFLSGGLRGLRPPATFWHLFEVLIHHGKFGSG